MALQTKICARYHPMSTCVIVAVLLKCAAHFTKSFDIVRELVSRRHVWKAVILLLLWLCMHVNDICDGVCPGHTNSSFSSNANKIPMIAQYSPNRVVWHHRLFILIITSSQRYTEFSIWNRNSNRGLIGHFRVFKSHQLYVCWRSSNTLVFRNHTNALWVPICVLTSFICHCVYAGINNLSMNAIHCVFSVRPCCIGLRRISLFLRLVVPL